jgi:hypothetical protein
MGVGAEAQAETFTASRWTAGNRLFPTQIVVSPECVLRIKRRWFGSDEESIALAKVASVRISTGMLWSDIRIDSAGGSNPILSHGHSKQDAQRIRDLIEKFQAEGARAAEASRRE